MAPPLAGSPRVNGHRDYIIKTVLHGLGGPVDGKTYTDMMIPMSNFDDEWIAAVGSYVRYSFGNTGGFITPADVARVRAANAGRKTLWTLPELTASLPAALFTDGWKLTASHNADAATGALALTGWNAGGQQAGMWFQVELPKPEAVTEIQFQSPPPGGRGGAGTAAAVTSSGAPVVAPPGFPRGYKVEVSADGAAWKTVAEGTGNGPGTIVTFEPVQAKFVRMSLTASAEDAPAWSIQSLRIFALTASRGCTDVHLSRAAASLINRDASICLRRQSIAQTGDPHETPRGGLVGNHRGRCGGHRPRAGQEPKPLEIWVVDVEGGKAALYVSPTGQTALIDTGFPGARDLDRIMAAIADAGVKQIDYLISTHYHVDHIGNLTELAKRIPIGTFVDHGPTVEGPDVTQIPPGPDGLTLTKPREQVEGFQAAYAELYNKAKRLVVKPGDRVPITGLEWRIATSAGNVLKMPLRDGGRPNPHCANFTPLPTNEGMVDPDDFHSVGSVIILGQFRAVDFGDMWRTKELELVCPNNPIGTVDLYFASSHGAIASGSRPFVHGLQPRVALVQNGTRKGAAVGPMTTIFSSPGLEGVWQMLWCTTGCWNRTPRGCRLQTSRTCRRSPAC